MIFLNDDVIKPEPEKGNPLSKSLPVTSYVSSSLSFAFFAAGVIGIKKETPTASTVKVSLFNHFPSY